VLHKLDSVSVMTTPNSSCSLPEAYRYLTVRKNNSKSKYWQQGLGTVKLSWYRIQFSLLIKSINYFLTVKLEKSSLQRMQKMALLSCWYASVLVSSADMLDGTVVP